MSRTLITLAQAKAQLVIETDDDDSAILLKCAEATGVVDDYLEWRADPSWTDRTVPDHVRTAILLVFAHLWRHRGDGEGGSPLTTGVKDVLRRSRDPSLA